MKQERNHYFGHFDVFFTVTRFTVMSGDRVALRTLNFLDAHRECWRVHDFVTETYDRMLAQNRPCEMMVAISHPLTRKQVDLFNDQNDAVSKAVGAAAAVALPVGWLKARTAVGTAAGFAMDSVLETRHAGDVIVAVQASVAGGIGPQHSSRATLIKAQGGLR